MLSVFRVYEQPRLFAVLLMGFASGLPLALTGATLAIWLTQAGVTLTAVGFFSLATLSYNFKFLWAPLVDRLAIPGLTRLLGRRRSWALVLQACLIAAILGLGMSEPGANTVATAAWAVAVAFFSASQDIVIDAYRVELLKPEEQGAGAAATQLGYRLGMIASGAGALWAAESLSWHGAYALMAALVLVGSAAVLAAPEPDVERPPRGGDWLRSTVAAPFEDFMRRPDWLLILVFVVLYKLGDATAGHMAGPFYVSLGFSNGEIAQVSKLFGIVASLAGVSLGGLVVYRLGVMPALLACGLMQMASNLMYLVQAWAGHDVLALTLTIGAENVAGGMGSAAFVAYLSALCSPAYTATQYALLSALAATARTALSSWGGAFADRFGWTAFFLLAVGLGLPGLLLLAALIRRLTGGPAAGEASAAAARPAADTEALAEEGPWTSAGSR